MSEFANDRPLRFVMIGAGFWARYQLAAWHEQPNVRCVGICDRDRAKATQLANRFGVADVFTDVATMLAATKPGVTDIVTSPATHKEIALLCAAHRTAAICQKPLAETIDDARLMVDAFATANLPLLVHENWRWQAPIRALNEQLKAGRIGKPFRARITFSCSFPVFDNQPFLATLPRFIVMDIGTHLLDCARFLFGEAKTVTCLTSRVNPKINGEDVATVLMPMGDDDIAVAVEMSYASRTEHERFPQTYFFIEGSEGSLEIAPDYSLRVTDATGTYSRRVSPPRYDWADPAYDLVQESMVGCIADLLAGLRGEKRAETDAADNLETLRLVSAAYESAEAGRTIHL